MPENFFAHATKETPEISGIIRHQTVYITLLGESFPENPFLEYAPFRAWLQTVIDSNLSIYCTIFLTYFNTASAEEIVELTEQLRTLAETSERTVFLEWKHHAHDEEILEAGQETLKDWKPENYKIVAVNYA